MKNCTFLYQEGVPMSNPDTTGLRIVGMNPDGSPIYNQPIDDPQWGVEKPTTSTTDKDGDE